MSRRTIRARWVVPVDAPPVENGCVHIEQGRITAVERASVGAKADVDHGDAMILPGFINAHTHLDLTAFRGCAPFLGSFTDWLRIVVAMQTADGGCERMDAGIKAGLRESVAAGVTCIADIGCGQRAINAWSKSPANIVGFFEAIGMGPRRHDDHPRSLRRAIASCELMRGVATPVPHKKAGETPAPQEGAARPGSGRILSASISPHAPYSTAPEVYREATAYCRKHALPICTHLAETLDEAEFLAHGTGPFRRLLEDRGLWDRSFTPPGCSPVEYAESLGLLTCRPLLAHGNYLSDSDISILARYGCSVAYCPRTHRFFEHAPHRYRDLLAAGVNVCLGTDSLASAPSLSMLDELRFLRSIDHKSTDASLLSMATIRGAASLNLQHELGSIAAAKRGDLAIVPLNNPNAVDPLTDLLHGDSHPTAAYIGGRPC